VPLRVSDGVGESDPLLVGEGVDDAVGTVAAASTAKAKLDSASVHAAPPEALVADAMTIDGAVNAVDRGAGMGPSVVTTTPKLLDDAVVPLSVIVADISAVGAEYVSVTVTVADATADDVPYANKLDPVPGAVVDGSA
jgi:hypothetical protein